MIALILLIVWLLIGALGSWMMIYHEGVFETDDIFTSILLTVLGPIAIIVTISKILDDNHKVLWRKHDKKR